MIFGFVWALLDLYWNDYLHCRIHTGLFICITGLGLGISISVKNKQNRPSRHLQQLLYSRDIGISKTNLLINGPLGETPDPGLQYIDAYP